MTTAEAKQYLRASLGSQVPLTTEESAAGVPAYGVQVELNEGHLDTALRSALNWLSVYAPRKGEVEIVTVPQVSKYDLSALPPSAEVVDVRISKGSKLPITLDLWSTELLRAGATWDVMDLAYILNYAGTIREITGTDFTWEYRYPFLYISPKPDRDYVLKVTYIIPYTAVEEVPFKYLDAFLTFAKGEVKEILGRIRGKYSGVPAPDGQIELDGDTLLQEGREDKERAREMLSRLLPSAGFVVG